MISCAFLFKKNLNFNRNLKKNKNESDKLYIPLGFQVDKSDFLYLMFIHKFENILPDYAQFSLFMYLRLFESVVFKL